MNLKTEAQYRQELANAWQLIDDERSATRLMREKLQAANSAAHSLAAQLCAVAEVAEKDGYTLIRRESVMDLVTRWRTQWDAAMKVPNFVLGRLPCCVTSLLLHNIKHRPTA